ncbi:hypothetical protein CEXT_1141 [Caerostris extrusa]|uniref:Uncharacterized protein n=1 Tax=Caerostris extrusa TaxID=172846 RepID=A0AAV4UU72_CAEEX|nr:hypothetical protein CEXT_1141 [Caerostris extrusa]
MGNEKFCADRISKLPSTLDKEMPTYSLSSTKDPEQQRHQTKEIKEKVHRTFSTTGILEKWTLGASGSTHGCGSKGTSSLLRPP